MRGYLSALLVFIIVATPAWAQRNFFVDNSCANNGNGLTDSCATSAGGAGRFKDIHSCDTLVAAGDICKIYKGSAPYYRQYEGGRNALMSGYRPLASGTASAPITYIGVDRMNPPVICSGPNCDDECSYTNSAIGVDNKSYIVFDNLVVKGVMTVTGSDHVTVRNIDISHGFTYSNSCNGGNDGNWSGFRTEWGTTNLLVQNCFIHDITRPLPDRGNGIKLYNTHGAVFEYLTIYNTLYSGFELKSNVTDITLRYSKLINVGTLPDGGDGIRGPNQLPPNGPYVIHHNLIAVPSANPSQGNFSSGFHHPTVSPGVANQFYHNTFYGIDFGYYVHEATDFQNMSDAINDNIFHKTSVTNGWSFVYSPYPGSAPASSNYSIESMDHNAFTSARFYWRSNVDGENTFTTLSSWQNFWSGKGRAVDSHSQIVDCRFVNPGFSPSADFHITNPACKTLSSSGQYVGAYETDTSCIGYGCSGIGSGDTLAPSAPANLAAR